MKKGKEPAEYTSDDEPTTDDSEEEVELNNGEMMNAPEEKAMSDAAKLPKSKAIKRLQRYRDNDRRRREKKLNYITSLEKENENLTYSISTATPTINILSNQREGLLTENQMWSTRLQSLNEGYIQSLEENIRLQQECIDLENLQQEQSRAPNAAQDPNSMLEPWQIQTSGPSHQHAHQLGGPNNAAYHSTGIMVPQQIQTSGLSHQHAHQLGGPHNAAYDSSGIMVPQQIQTSGSSHQPGGPHNADHHSYGLHEPGMRGLGQSSGRTWVAWVESCINNPDQDVPSPQLSADDSVLGSEMPSTAQLQEGMSCTDVEKVTSDEGQQIE